MSPQTVVDIYRCSYVDMYSMSVFMHFFNLVCPKFCLICTYLSLIFYFVLSFTLKMNVHSRPAVIEFRYINKKVVYKKGLLQHLILRDL